MLVIWMGKNGVPNKSQSPIEIHQIIYAIQNKN